jgi:hypothetical protein
MASSMIVFNPVRRLGSPGFAKNRKISAVVQRTRAVTHGLLARRKPTLLIVLNQIGRCATPDILSQSNESKFRGEAR